MKKIIGFFFLLWTLNTLAHTDWVNGVVIRTQKNQHKIILKHEKIPSICMDAMTMPFAVLKTISLEQFQPGDKVRFQVSATGNDLDITAIEKIK